MSNDHTGPQGQRERERIAEALDRWRADLAPTTPHEAMRADLAQAAALLRSEPVEQEPDSVWHRRWIELAARIGTMAMSEHRVTQDLGVAFLTDMSRVEKAIQHTPAPPGAPEAQEPHGSEWKAPPAPPSDDCPYRRAEFMFNDRTCEWKMVRWLDSEPVDVEALDEALNLLNAFVCQSGDCADERAKVERAEDALAALRARTPQDDVEPNVICPHCGTHLSARWLTQDDVEGKP